MQELYILKNKQSNSELKGEIACYESTPGKNISACDDLIKPTLTGPTASEQSSLLSFSSCSPLNNGAFHTKGATRRQKGHDSVRISTEYWEQTTPQKPAGNPTIHYQLTKLWITFSRAHMTAGAQISFLVTQVVQLRERGCYGHWCWSKCNGCIWIHELMGKPLHVNMSKCDYGFIIFFF